MNAGPQSHVLPPLPLWDVCARRHGGNAQSVAAHRRTAHRKKGDLLDVLAMMRDQGGRGLTCREYCLARGRQMHEVSGRFSDAKALGCARVLRDGADRAVTRDGCAALEFLKMPDRSD